ATIKGQAPDKGLYIPAEIPIADRELIHEIASIPDHEIAYRVIQPYVGDTIPPDQLFSIVKETLNFPIPLHPLNENIFSLELFHGPTLAFKDVGARFMSRCLGYFVKNGPTATTIGQVDRSSGRTITILVATSGDTGGAVANGFYDVEGINVVILYPSGKVSSVQEKQLTTLGKNIHALEVKGTFDDCQAMVKKAFADAELNKKLFLSSANSINVARWLPQQFYYFLAWKQWPDTSNPPVFSVPSGNFGNICAGLLAWRSGLPVSHFIAACNANDVIPLYLQTGKLAPKHAVTTLSNAMDVGDPSNFARIMEIFQHDLGSLKKQLSAESVNDKDTIEAIRKIHLDTGYTADPHGAVGWVCLEHFIQANPGRKGIFLETAHPVKFPDAVEKIIGKKIEIPIYLTGLFSKEKKALCINKNYEDLRSFLLQ
ncbi:MAG TPA: threonine synthase, partial [Chitinophagaceae bacterium]|nr:threonine synthase [Chitinophagaceae bacterium]